MRLRGTFLTGGAAARTVGAVVGAADGAVGVAAAAGFGTAVEAAVGNAAGAIVGGGEVGWAGDAGVVAGALGAHAANSASPVPPKPSRTKSRRVVNLPMDVPQHTQRTASASARLRLAAISLSTRSTSGYSRLYRAARRVSNRCYSQGVPGNGPWASERGGPAPPPLSAQRSVRGRRGVIKDRSRVHPYSHPQATQQKL